MDAVTSVIAGSYYNRISLYLLDLAYYLSYVYTMRTVQAERIAYHFRCTKGLTNMKNMIRAFALSLVVTGAFASTHINNNTATPVLHAKLSAMPVPSCPPGNPNNTCGFCTLGNNCTQGSGPSK